MKRLADLSDDDLAQLARRAGRELPDAPGWLIESAQAMWRAPQPAPSLRQRIVAVLGFDSWATQPALALRSAAAATRHLLFTAQGRDIDLRISAADPARRPPVHFAIAGQVLGPGEGGVVSLARSGEEGVSASLDDFGEFRFGGLPGGKYVLTVRFGVEEIVLPEIDVAGEAQP